MGWVKVRVTLDALTASVETDLICRVRGELATICEQESDVKPPCSGRNTL